MTLSSQASASVMASTATLLLLLLQLLLAVRPGSAGYAACRLENGPVPLAFRCDDFETEGDDSNLRTLNSLNTAENTETPEMTAARMNQGRSDDGASRFSNLFDSLTGSSGSSSSSSLFLQPDSDGYNPVFDAYCFNEDYPVPTFDSIESQLAMYAEYQAIFDEAFDDDVLETQDRIPGMWLRMCFHDNSIDDDSINFRTYVANAIDPTTRKWTAESRFLVTSGADASNLICPEERTHPNNNMDQSATKVLNRIQRSLKNNHPSVSYADLLHNGCNAATIYLTGTDPTTALTTNPMTFGRQDACHIDVKCGKKYALCGPTEILPGVNFNLQQTSDWFTNRGMSLCSMMALMWTHTTIEDLDVTCPIQKLACTATAQDVTEFENQNQGGGRYFNAGDELDYFDFFLNRGVHTPGGGGGGGRGGCDWDVDGTDLPWPMTRTDCVLAVSNVDATLGSSSALAQVVRSFVHNATYYNRYDLLQCALNQLGGTGTGATDNANNACAQVLPTECRASTNHMFGSVYSTQPATTVPRITVNPRCEQFGYRRRRHLLSSVEEKEGDEHPHDDASPTGYVRNTYAECLDVEYDIYLVVDGIHFSMVTTPVDDNHQTPHFCPPLLIHSVYDETKGPASFEMEKVMIVFPSDIESRNEEMTFPLGRRWLYQILESYETVHVGYQNNISDVIYHPLTNNCVALLRNLAQSLNLLPLSDDQPLQEFITHRLLKSGVLERMMHEYEKGNDDDESLKTLSTTTANEMMTHLMEYYMY